MARRIVKTEQAFTPPRAARQQSYLPLPLVQMALLHCACGFQRPLRGYRFRLDGL